MYGKLFNIKINNNSTTNEQLFSDFEEWFDYEHQRIEEECLLQQEQKEQRLLIKPQLKKIIDEDVSCTDDLRDVFPKYYDKSFLPVKKGDSKNFVFFKYSTNNGNVDMIMKNKNLNLKNNRPLPLQKNLNQKTYF
jgi:hypothetical protein